MAEEEHTEARTHRPDQLGIQTSETSAIAHH